MAIIPLVDYEVAYHAWLAAKETDTVDGSIRAHEARLQALDALVTAEQEEKDENIQMLFDNFDIDDVDFMMFSAELNDEFNALMNTPGGIPNPTVIDPMIPAVPAGFEPQV